MGEEQTTETTATTETTEATETTPFDWRAGLPDDMREDPSLQTIHGENNEEIISALAKQHINSQRAMGLDKVALPGKNASDEEVREYYTKIGCPESLDGYVVPTEGLSDQFDTELYESAREEAHRIGMRPDQLAVMARFMDSRQAEAREKAAEANTAQIAEWEEKLRVEHGEAFEENTAMAKHIVHEFGSEELEKLLEDRGLGSHPALFNMFAKIGRAMGEDEVLGLGATHEFANTPGQATEAWDILKGDEKFMAMLIDAKHPGHKGAVEKQTKLFQQGAKA